MVHSVDIRLDASNIAMPSMTAINRQHSSVVDIMCKFGLYENILKSFIRHTMVKSKKETETQR